ncbi:response regulator [Candidatus Woesearchaeota archaeon]|nr:response regulator [Candidatus Woesearchaeota archaeon]
MSIDKAIIRVLLVDDNPDHMELLEQVLSRLGYSTIKTAADGLEALALAKDYQPHVVLMDTQMPGQAGYDVCRQMRQEDYGRLAVIGGMSDSGNIRYSELWIEGSGADFYVDKSTLLDSKERQKELDEMIQEYLAEHQQG